jgi:hypothetical protein
MRHPPDKENGGPGHHTKTTAAAQIESPSTPLIGTDSSSEKRHELQLELVTVGDYIAPAGRRTLPAATARCAVCGAVTVHRDIERGVTQERVGTCGHKYRLHVPAPVYGADYDDTDSWADVDGSVYRGNQSWVPRSAA